MESPTVDQLRIFIDVVEQGSFSATARRFNRAQSAVSYTVRTLEEQIGNALFDRSAYRPQLTEAGRALLPYAHRIINDVAIFDSLALGLAKGLEAELKLVVDSMFPMPLVVPVLAEFERLYPSVQLRLTVATLSGAAQALTDNLADVGLILGIAKQTEDLDYAPAYRVGLVAVAAPGHMLAQADGALTAQMLRDHVQLVLSETSAASAKADFGVQSTKVWRLADLGAKHAMLLAGLGWGSMPDHLVEEDLATGRLVRLKIERWDGETEMPRLLMVVATRKGGGLGPAGRWLARRLAL